MNRIVRFLSAFLAALVLCVSLTGVAIGETATAVQLMKTEGTVSVTNNRARELTAREKMKLYNGYFVSTDEESYAWMNLDDTKLAKLDAVSRMELRKDGKKLQLLVHEGELFFNVTEPLENDETMEICTSTMVAGIRGTSGCIRKISSRETQLYVLEGSVQCTVTNPVTGEVKTDMVSSGETAVSWVDKEEKTCDIEIRRIQKEEIPGFILKELVEDDELQEKIFQKSGMDFGDLTEEEATARQKKDEEEVAQQLAEIRVRTDMEKVISKEPVWGSAAEESTTKEATTEAETTTEAEPITEAEPTTQEATTEEPTTEAETTTEAEATTEEVTTEEPTTEAETTTEAEATTEEVTTEEPTTEEVTTEEATTEEATTEEATTEAKPEIYTVIFDDGSSTKSVSVEEQQTADMPADPVREGYTFDGWYTVEGEAFTADTVVVEDFTVTAKWSVNSYTVTYMLDGEQYGAQETHEYGASVVIREKATKEGYTVSDWSLTESFTMPARDVTITATSTINSYTVTFDANEGTLTGAGTLTADYNTTITLPAEPTREGYTFQGWFTEADAGTEFTESTPVTDNITLYAHWTAAEAKIVFDACDGTEATVGTVGVTDGAITDAFPTEQPVRTGYTFDGWYTAQDDSGEKVTAYPSVFPAGTTTYYAHWTYITGDFVVTGGEPEVDYRYGENAETGNTEDKVLTICSGTPLTISGVTTKDVIAVASGVNANITLDNLNIDLSSTGGDLGAPVRIPDGAGAVITLQGDNTLMSNSKPGLEKIGVAQNLTIKGDGSLTAESEYGAGIGSGSYENTGNITIESGTIKAKCSGEYTWSAGIGGGGNSNASNITISGGTVTAEGGGYGAGIGGGTFNSSDSTGSGNGSNIRISGGTVTAIGGINGGAGIGGAAYGGFGTDIIISGGVVTATGGGRSNGGAGIGGGSYGGQGSGIIISGGVVTATGSSGGGTGIGGGYKGPGSNITISGGIVTVTANCYNGAGIGGGAYGGQGNDITISGGIVKVSNTEDFGTKYYIGGENGEIDTGNFTGAIVFKDKTGEVYGEVTLDQDMEIAADETLHIPVGSKVIIPDGMALTNNGLITFDADNQSEAITGNLVLGDTGAIMSPAAPPAAANVLPLSEESSAPPEQETETPVGEPVTEEAAASEPVTGEPAADEPVTDEPATDEPEAIEPVTEESGEEATAQ